MGQKVGIKLLKIPHVRILFLVSLLFVAATSTYGMNEIKLSLIHVLSKSQPILKVGTLRYYGLKLLIAQYNQ